MNTTSQPPTAGWGRGLRRARQALALATLLLWTGRGVSFAQAQNYTVLYSFQCGADGGVPYGGLVRDSAGNFYGTTTEGGASGLGAIFEISASGQETVLYSFGSSPTDGTVPDAGLVRDAAGSLYGTTYAGGASNLGTVFKLSAGGTETVLHSFTGTDGSYPLAGLILDAEGNLYGTTSADGFGGTVFEISASGRETVLHSFPFRSTTDGNAPAAGLVRDVAGNLYGTTEYGGAFDAGTVFKVTAKGNESVLYSFCSQADCTDGALPVAGLLPDPAGNLYGTTENGGALGGGTVFKFDRTGAQSVLYSFGSGGGGGYSPQAGLFKDGKGDFYGTTYLGGILENGSVFKVSPAGQETVFHRFTGPPNDGDEPLGGLIRDPAGSLYGTTSFGGTRDCGTVFKIAP